MVKLIIMVGISGSGKSTKAERLLSIYPNAVLLSSDALRKELYNDENDQTHNSIIFEELHKRAIMSLKAGHDVIYDATNITLKNRKQFKNYVDNNFTEPYEYIACVMNTPVEVCIERDVHRSRSVGEEVIRKQYRQYEAPQDSEGFDTIVSSVVSESEK